eukprot:scaffold7979_cov129-Isochrysis_galbana.AAC.1
MWARGRKVSATHVKADEIRNCRPAEAEGRAHQHAPPLGEHHDGGRSGGLCRDVMPTADPEGRGDGAGPRWGEDGANGGLGSAGTTASEPPGQSPSATGGLLAAHGKGIGRRRARRAFATPDARGDAEHAGACRCGLAGGRSDRRCGRLRTCEKRKEYRQSPEQKELPASSVGARLLDDGATTQPPSADPTQDRFLLWSSGAVNEYRSGRDVHWLQFLQRVSSASGRSLRSVDLSEKLAAYIAHADLSGRTWFTFTPRPYLTTSEWRWVARFYDLCCHLYAAHPSPRDPKRSRPHPHTPRGDGDGIGIGIGIGTIVVVVPRKTPYRAATYRSTGTATRNGRASSTQTLKRAKAKPCHPAAAVPPAVPPGRHVGATAAHRPLRLL